MILHSLSKKRVCFSDENWFVLHLSADLQTNQIWVPWDPEEVVCRFQGDSKVMAWVALIDGEVDGGQARLPRFFRWQAISLNAA